MADIKDKSTDELKKEVAEKRESLRAFRFGGSGSRVRNVREGRNLRREIARILTELGGRSRPKVASKGKNA